MTHNLPRPIGAKTAAEPIDHFATGATDKTEAAGQLENGIQTDPLPINRSKPPINSPADQSIEGDPIWLPGPVQNGVLAALRHRGLYQAPLGEGQHQLTCPWAQRHSDPGLKRAAYFEPDDNWPIGGFKCHDSSCVGRCIRDLLQCLDVPPNAARMKGTIRVVDGELHRVVDAAERELARARRHYQRGGLIVTVVTDPETRETRVQEIRQPALVRALAGVVNWERFDARARSWRRTDPPARHAAVLSDASSYSHLPVLRGLARQPYLRPDGSLMMDAGYDSATNMFGVFDAREFSIPDRPTRKDAEDALQFLEGLLAEFKFVRDSDLAAALSAMLTAAIRPSLPHAPMFHVRAHVVGSGKSYLCELIWALATPQRGTPTTFPGDDEESRKLLLAELLRAPPVIEFDNLTGDLVAHKSLCTALTSEHMTGRILGFSKTASVSTRTLFLSSGNNVGPIQDMTRRCITINLDPGCEVPAARSFKRPNLVRDILSHRGRVVSAALTITRAWIVAGRPKTDCKPMAGFGDWSDLVRQPLLWLGLADPTESVFEAMAEDPDREILDRLFDALDAVVGSRPFMVRELVELASRGFDAHVELREVLHDIAGERGELNRRRLGRWIKRNVGRIVSGRRLARASGNRSAGAWQLVPVSSVSSVSSQPGMECVKQRKVDNAYARASRGD